MAVDPGRRRIGIALSDELGVLASPLTVIEHRDRVDDLARLGSLIRQHQPEILLVGLPLLPSGDAGRQARYCEGFAEALRQEFGLPVQLWNESYSTVEARRRRNDRGRARGRGLALDAEAAAIFLQEYLDSRR